MAISTYYANRVLDSMLGDDHGALFPATVYIRLYVNTTEVTGNNYAAIAVTNDDTNFPPAVDGEKTNGVTFTYPEASGSWGLVNNWRITDVSGNIIAENELENPLTPLSGNSPFFTAGELVITQGPLFV